MARTEKTKYLIIGNSAGGIGAAEAIRGVDGAGATTIISDESYLAYSRPMISEYLKYKKTICNYFQKQQLYSNFKDF